MDGYQIFLPIYFATFGFIVNAEFGLDKVMDKNSYGPYIVHTKELTTCADEVKKNAGQSKKKPLSSYNVTESTEWTEMYITAHQTMNLRKCQTKINMYSIVEDTKKTLFNYNIKNICAHFAFGPVFKMQLKLSDDCTMKKGAVIVKVNVTELTMKFSGDKFFYGEYQYKTVMRCSGQSFFCFMTTLVFDKKKP